MASLIFGDDCWEASSLAGYDVKDLKKDTEGGTCLIIRIQQNYKQTFTFFNQLWLFVLKDLSQYFVELESLVPVQTNSHFKIMCLANQTKIYKLENPVLVPFS